jgi:hypothetical protein
LHRGRGVRLGRSANHPPPRITVAIVDRTTKSLSAKISVTQNSRLFGVENACHPQDKGRSCFNLISF